MKRLLLLCLAVMMLLAVSNVAFAQRRRDDRLRRGIRSGQITRDEARLLRERRRAIRQERRVFRSDGRLARDERRELRRDRRDQARLYRRLRRNDDRRSVFFDNRGNHRGNGYYRRGAGSPRHPVFGRRNRY